MLNPDPDSFYIKNLSTTSISQKICKICQNSPRVIRIYLHFSYVCRTPIARKSHACHRWMSLRKHACHAWIMCVSHLRQIDCFITLWLNHYANVLPWHSQWNWSSDSLYSLLRKRLMAWAEITSASVYGIFCGENDHLREQLTIENCKKTTYGDLVKLKEEVRFGSNSSWKA